MTWTAQKNERGAFLIMWGDEKIALMNCLDEAEANAAFIVRAVNSHDALVRALKSARAIVALTGDVQVLAEIDAALKDAERTGQ